jgi:hypothetical protein
MASDTGRWFSVQTHVRIAPGAVLPERGQTYEERVTLWNATDAATAAQRGREEAESYAGEHGYEMVDSIVAYELFDVPDSGAEVWSYVRESSLDPAAYIGRYVTEGDPATDESDL